MNENPKELSPEKTMDTSMTLSTPSNSTKLKRYMAQNYLIIWMDDNTGEINTDCRNAIAQLHTVVSDIHTFTERDECIDFLTEINDRKVFLITGNVMGQFIIPLIHDIPQLHSVFIFCHKETPHQEWIANWNKIRNVYTEITPFCEALQSAVKQCNQDSIPMCFVGKTKEGSSQSLNQLEPLFMYTQIFKETLLQIDYNQEAIKDLINFWRSEYSNNAVMLKRIDEFEHHYCPQSSIGWYSRESFVYQTLNWALRVMDSKIMLKMGFFIRDLHYQLVKLHQEQIRGPLSGSFIVYRGQGLSIIDFEKLQNTKGGLMSFNSFLSTSKDREFSLAFAESASSKTDTVGILFQMLIDPKVLSSPFASIMDSSFYPDENEILFSMHTVFRVKEIKQIVCDIRLWKVELTLTNDKDPELAALSFFIQLQHLVRDRWSPLGELMTSVGQFDQAEEFYNKLLKKSSNDIERSHIYYSLGCTKFSQKNTKKH
jgi:tetratricopeptide (TPR) repeat protein